MFTVDFATRIVYSDANINDFPAARSALRALEETEFGKVNPRIFDFSKIALGGGAYMYDITFVHGYTLQFPSSGAYAISGGNWNSTINDTGVLIIVTKAAAYAVTASGGSALTPDEHDKLMALPVDVASAVNTDALVNKGDIIAAVPAAADVVAALNATTIPVDVKKMNGAQVVGTGTVLDKWRG